ncbi:DgyrCDS8840 [Dimorphilus gyrociliatus]|uniref:DgyrCDS8840 n=1 Tax=Dimorphilus gyrociliatus TaxID=2664684 RepID=A0A7I8VVA0_9ANNE|nr:DgyrCDS8840 [Dimorphilus gyrociliatus]
MEFAEFIKTPQVQSVVVKRPLRQDLEGALCVTGHHLIVSNRDKEEFLLIHKNVEVVEKQLSSGLSHIKLKCKNFEVIHIEFKSSEECSNVASSIENLSNVESTEFLYPFFYRPNSDIKENGWEAFKVETEFARIKYKTDQFRLSYVNKEFDVCPSYPQALIVPKTIDDDELRIIAKFRHLGRFPVLSYYHKETQASLMRCSQPLVGTNNNRCKEDEKLLKAILTSSHKGFLIDTRSAQNSKVEASRGKGVESDIHYSQWRKIHQNIERHFVLHESLSKLIEVVNDKSCTSDKWISRLESSGWMTHMSSVLTCACFVAQCIDRDKASVVVHGSDGTDSTLQVTSLAQLLLDPDCRTVRGFQALIEREWIQGGHPFGQRCAKIAFGSTPNRQEAPVFLLFLDCVWQIWQQYPCSFEFSDKFLVLLFHNAYSSQYGTFLSNCEFDRRKYDIKNRTVSLWSYVNQPNVIGDLMNPLYEPNHSVIWPSVAPQSLNFWSNVYAAFKPSRIQQDKLVDYIRNIKDEDKQLKSRVIKLRRQLANLEREAIEKNLIPHHHSKSSQRSA